VIVDGRHEGEVKAAVAYAAETLGLSRDWLNNWVGMYTRLVEHLQRLYESFFPDEQLNPLAATYLPEVAREIHRRRDR
jgi:hypothetical protein